MAADRAASGRGAIYDRFIWPTRVYWEDTDAGGVVYHASYLRFLERARTEWLRGFGWSQQRLRAELDLVFAVHRMDLVFQGPARLDDELAVEVALVQAGGASLSFAQRVLRGDEVLLTAGVDVACLRASDFRPRRMPKGLFDAAS